MSNAIIQRLAGYLSVNESRSGEAIAHELGCSRTAVWKHVESLRTLGIEIDAVAGKGYRLREPLELLDGTLILAGLDPAVREKLRDLDIESSLDSTNSALRRLAIEDQHAAVILAEHQSGGRGRRGRQWHSPYARNIYLSIGWKLENSLSELGCLSLVVALATARALSRAGLNGHMVKWPNDLLLDGRKYAVAWWKRRAMPRDRAMRYWAWVSMSTCLRQNLPRRLTNHGLTYIPACRIAHVIPWPSCCWKNW